MTGLVTVSVDAGRLVALVITAAALLGAIGYLVRIGRRVHCRVMVAARLIDQELTNNHGSSIKDDVHGIAVAVGTLSREFDDLKRDFYSHIDRRVEPPTWTP